MKVSSMPSSLSSRDKKENELQSRRSYTKRVIGFDWFSSSLTILATAVLILSSSCCDATTLHLWSDQPAILDSNLTFYAKLINPSRDEYTLTWQENFHERFGVESQLNKANGFSTNLTRSYSNSTVSPGGYSITCEVYYYQLWFRQVVATELLNFNLTRTFPGKLLANQPGVPRKNPHLISTQNVTELIVDLHDPSGYLKTAENVTFSWFSNKTLIANTTVPKLMHNFTEEGDYIVKVNMVAFFPTSSPKPKGNSLDSNGNASLIYITKHGYFKIALTTVGKYSKNFF